MKKVKMVSCPHCKTEFNYYESEYRPFCQEKCKMIDLGNWLSENYTIASQGPVEEEDEEQE